MRLLFPYANYLVTFFVWGNYLYNFNDPIMRHTFANFTVSVLMILYAIYFLNYEVKQVLELGFNYFTSVWNLFDSVPPISISFVV